MIAIKRIYESKNPDDGYRVLVDRLWPRGVSKEKAALDLWLKDIAPSDELRKWFGHDPDKWESFRNKYQEELSDKTDLLTQLKELEKEHGRLTLLYGAHDEQHNQALVLAEALKIIKN
ncbi:MAG TPA: DUF488 domain-containing protein [Candidatus Saccharimonadales bacterium]|nr:DUF488 domain-containing protein [Candidatus Saccharimonadales bacterium]